MLLPLIQIAYFIFGFWLFLAWPASMADRGENLDLVAMLLLVLIVPYGYVFLWLMR